MEDGSRGVRWRLRGLEEVAWVEGWSVSKHAWKGMTRLCPSIPVCFLPRQGDKLPVPRDPAMIVTG